ncbi:actin assembly-inducing protein ActA [Listeria monocytogenes]|nr:actin assembly-inducing protein ActA [Listeria monocytogenes]
MGLNRFMRAMMVVFITANCITINPDIIFATTDSEDSSLNTDEWEEEKTEEQPSEERTGPRYETAREVSSRDIKELEKSNKVKEVNKADLVAMLKEKAEKGPNNNEQTENTAANEGASGSDQPAPRVEHRHPGLPSDTAAAIKKRRKAVASSDSELESLTYPDKSAKTSKKKVTKEAVAATSESDLDSSMQSADESTPQPLKANQKPFFPKVFKKIKDAGKWVRDKIDENPEVKKAIVDKSAGLIDQLLTKKKNEEVNASDFPPPPTDEELRFALPEAPRFLGFNAPTPSELSSFEFPPPPTEDELEIMRESAQPLDSNFTRGDLASLKNAIDSHSQNFSDFPPIPTEVELNGGVTPASEGFSSMDSGEFTDDEYSQPTEEEIDRLADLRDRGAGNRVRNAGFLPPVPYASNPIPVVSPKTPKLGAPILVSDITKKAPFKNSPQQLKVPNKPIATKNATKKTTSVKTTSVKTAPKLASFPTAKSPKMRLGDKKTPVVEKQSDINNQPMDVPNLPTIQKEDTEKNKNEIKPQAEEKTVGKNESAKKTNGKNRSVGMEEGKLVAKSAEDEKAKEEPANRTTLILAMLAIGVLSLGAFIKILQVKRNG